MKLQFPEKRKYPIAFTTFLVYIAWHPLGDFLESLIIGWNIVPGQLFTWDFWVWWIPFAQRWQWCYSFAFFAYFMPITVVFYAWYFLRKKLNLNRYLVYGLIGLFAVPGFVFQLVPSRSVAYQNDIDGFRDHGMEPLNPWMYFHMGWWFVWMITPHLIGLFKTEKQMLKLAGIVWLVFLIVWITSCVSGKFIYVPVT